MKNEDLSKTTIWRIAEFFYILCMFSSEELYTHCKNFTRVMSFVEQCYVRYVSVQQKQCFALFIETIILGQGYLGLNIHTLDMPLSIYSHETVSCEISRKTLTTRGSLNDPIQSDQRLRFRISNPTFYPNYIKY